MKHTVVVFVLILAIIAGCTRSNQVKQEWKPDEGYVPDEETASKLAEVIWTRIYGKGIEENRPFKVTLKDSTVWIIEGSLKSNAVGGAPYAEIQKLDGKILTVTHTK